MKRFRVFLAIGCSILTMSGCATLADSVKAKGTGPYQVYDRPYDEVWTTVIEVIESSKLELVSKDKKEGQILAQKGIDWKSYGQNVAVFVTHDSDNAKTRVEVDSKKSMATNIFATNWATYIFKGLDAKLKKH